MKRDELAHLMQTLDDAWNAGPGSPLWETFRKRHTVEKSGILLPSFKPRKRVNDSRSVIWNSTCSSERL